MSEPLDPYRTPSAPPPPPGPPAVGVRPGLPWDREKTGNAFLETVKRLITMPVEAFREARQKGDYASPLIFGVVLVTLATVVGQLWSLLFGTAWVDVIGANLPPESRGFLEQMGAPTLGGVLFALILAPFLAVIWLFVWSGIVHLFLLMVGGTRDSVAGFEGSLRVISYSSVSNLAALVPFVGGLIQFVWGIILQILGIAELHQTSRGKAALAVLLPLVLCCLCGVALGVMFGAALFAAITGAANQ
ncbi:MAG TPA: YIP1 family protein [Thermoanaerobaculia bacterium]|nr:YIP1 family protein [Thermoanaerobaculia bacterium]